MIGVIWGLMESEDYVVKVGELDDGNNKGRGIPLSLRGLQNCSSSWNSCLLGVDLDSGCIIMIDQNLSVCRLVK